MKSRRNRSAQPRQTSRRWDFRFRPFDRKCGARFDHGARPCVICDREQHRCDVRGGANVPAAVHWFKAHRRVSASGRQKDNPRVVYGELSRRCCLLDSSVSVLVGCACFPRNGCRFLFIWKSTRLLDNGRFFCLACREVKAGGYLLICASLLCNRCLVRFFCRMQL